MASVEIIGLLCAGSTRYHEQGGSGSNTDKLSRSELAGLLAGLDKASMNYALAKYALDQDAERMLIAHVRVWAAGVAVRESWQIVKGRPIVSNMAALAVFESVRPNRCCRCEGRGVVSNRVCLVCNGSGYKALSGRKVAEAISVDECSYRRLWKQRYDQIYTYVTGLDASINNSLHRSDREINYACS
ncbi:MAG: hypothetical protein ACXW04_01130 [Methylobacter sp.]